MRVCARRVSKTALLLVQLRHAKMAAVERRAVLQRGFQRPDLVIFQAGSVLRGGEQHGAFGIAGLIVDNLAQTANGLLVVARAQIEPPKQQLEVDVKAGFAPAFLERGDRLGAVQCGIVAGAKRLPLLVQGGVHRADDPIGFAVGGIALERGFRGLERLAHAILPRVQRRELRA